MEKTMNLANRFMQRLVASLTLLTTCALAQTSTTSLQGTVTDPRGGAVANATVELVSVDTQVQRTVITDPQGEYRFQFLPPGMYSLTVTAQGFARFEAKHLQLLVNTPSTANVELRLGQAAQT